jgi:hypothetical protein
VVVWGCDLIDGDDAELRLPQRRPEVTKRDHVKGGSQLREDVHACMERNDSDRICDTCSITRAVRHSEMRLQFCSVLLRCLTPNNGTGHFDVPTMIS